ncbi:hypothetical protein ACFLU6_08195, partial [Acidobacteriota bacterium]
MTMNQEENSELSVPAGNGAIPGIEVDSYIKLLASLKAVEPNENQITLVARIARWIPASEILEFIAGVPKWYTRWEIKEAIFQNPQTPANIQEEIGTCLAVINMMYELDTKDLSEKERDGMREDIRSLIQILNEEDRKSVRQRALKLAEARAQRLEEEKKSEEKEEEIQRRVSKAYEAQGYEDLLRYADDPEPRISFALLQNPTLTDDDLVNLLQDSIRPQRLFDQRGVASRGELLS